MHKNADLINEYLGHADVAQMVAHILGKDEVTGSIPVISSKKSLWDGGCLF